MNHDKKNSMRDELMAYHLGALPERHEVRIRKLLDSDPDWQAADAEAHAMLDGLRVAGVVDAEPPRGLATRTAERFAATRSRDVGMRRLLAAAVLLVVLTPALAYAVRYLRTAPEPAALLWRADATLAAGGLFAPEAVVRATEGGAPLAGVELVATLADENGKVTALGTGRTTAAGTLEEPWRVPQLAAGAYRLRVEARDAGRALDRYEADVSVRPNGRLVVATDRPRARPGEAIRARALFAGADGGLPVAGRDIAFELFDRRGNRLGRETRATSRFGLAWAEFPLDAGLPEGTYEIRATADGVIAHRTFEVLTYSLPPYRVQVNLARPWFGIDEPITGTVEARTFDGQAIAGLEASVALAPRRVVVKLDAAGRGRFALKRAPAGRHRLTVDVQDPAGQRATTSVTVVVSPGDVVIDALPEAGELVPGVENRIYLVARRPDGVPARGSLDVRGAGDVTTVELDERGVGMLTLVPRFSIARAIGVRPHGTSSWTEIELEARRGWSGTPVHGGLLLRSAQAVVAAGERVDLTVLAARREGNVVLAAKTGGRTVAIGGAALRDGRCRASLFVPRGIAGDVMLEATLFGSDDVWRDRRLLLVRGDSGLTVRVATERERYRPGERARFSFEVTDAEGSGVPAAVSVVGVDEALLALAGRNPGVVQALRAAELKAIPRPGFPVDPARLPRDGVFAHAAVASLRPPTVRAMVLHLADILPAEVLRDGRGENLQRAFAPNASLDAREYRDAFLAQLRRAGHADVADSLSTLARTTRSLADGGWVDHGPRRVGEAARRGDVAGQQALVWLLAAASIAVLVGLLARMRDGGAALTLATVVAIALGLVGGQFQLDLWLLMRLLWAAAFVSHATLYWVKRPAGARMHLCLLGLIHLFAAAMLLDGEGDPAGALVVCGLLLAMFQAPVGRERWIAVPLVVAALVLLVFGGVATVLVPKGQFEAAKTVAMSDAMNVAASLRDRPLLVGVGAADAGTPSMQRPRLRADFRETLLFAPELVTNEQGRATYEIEVADSLTRWLIQADAIGAAGGVAYGEGAVVVTQPFAVDLALPASVTEGDVLHVQAVVRNTGDAPRDVRVTLEVEGGESLLTGPRTVEVGARSVVGVAWPVRFSRIGVARLTATAHAAGEADAVARTLRVEPDGRPISFGASARVDKTGTLEFAIPAAARRETIRGSIRVHRSPLTQVIEGLESMLREPHGCFEQTSSVNYPNIMVLRYLAEHGRDEPEIRARAQDLLARGAQRLFGFEVGMSGGFSLYGRAPASVWLSAYGLMQLQDMALVHPVDPKLLARTRAFLTKREGSWLGEEAYIVWALGRSASAERVDRLSGKRAELERDPYLCALAVLALQPHDREFAAKLAESLVGLEEFTAARKLGWGGGRRFDVETAALVALALHATARGPEVTDRVVAQIQEHASPNGGWGSTHATVFALKALIASARRQPDPAEPLEVAVEVGGDAFALNAERLHVPWRATPGRTTARIRVADGSAVVRIGGRAYVPWDAASGERGLAIAYDRTTVARGGHVVGTLTLQRGAGAMHVPMVEWGLPAGFRPVPAALAAHVQDGRVTRWELSGRTLRLYLPDLTALAAQLSVPFVATARGELRAAPSRAYPYYRADLAVAARPARFSVR